MLSADAHSFQRKSRLAISLSWVAGYTNVVTLAVTGHVVSHATGNASLLAHAVGLHLWPEAGFFAYLLLMFFAGAVASALMTESALRRGSRSRYTLPIAVEALLLTCFAVGIDHSSLVTPETLHAQYLLCGLATAAMGLQNATITKISGATVRTTHLTGVVTDLGLETVQFLLWCYDHLRSPYPARRRRASRIIHRHPAFLRLALLGSIVTSFILGAFLGTLLFALRPTLAMLPPICFLAYLVTADLLSRRRTTQTSTHFPAA